MAKEWAPSVWGRRWTRSPDWRLRLVGQELSLAVQGRTYTLIVEDRSSCQLHSGIFWTDFTVFSGSPRQIRIDGLPNSQAAELTHALELAAVEKRLRDDAEFVRRGLTVLRQWLRMASDQERAAEAGHRWFTHDMQQALAATRPTADVAGMRARLKKDRVVALLGEDAQAIQRSLELWELDWARYWARYNREHTERELVACKALFDTVERQPLTDEQARAVVCFDNRVQVVASAGSGKTSTMVAKAAYALHRNLAAPNRMVLLAFNKRAADELKERTAQAFERVGMGGIAVEASTFHALGLRIIGKATGEKPDIPDWAIDTAGGLRKLAAIVDTLKDRDPSFRTRWDLFRFVFKRDVPAFGASEPADVWDAQGKGALLTARGERVKSQEEVMIADWLFYNGVEYRYEGPYEARTADEHHRQYRPDFYYPAVRLYHEHFALDARGQAPAHFEGYMAGVAWKRDLHREMGTALFETTSHGLRHGDDFQRLEAELTARGVVLDPNPDRTIPDGGNPPMLAAELAALIRTFIGHAKSNGLSIEAIRQRLEAMPDVTFKPRHRMFLDLAEPILAAWDAALAAEGGIDFEDMLNLAAEHLEAGRCETLFDLVMADEFQDASRARARLCRALVQAPHRHLFAVGDDWQSINRFAGADVSVMTRFKQWFGHGQVLKLEQTFRCPQPLCDVSSAFVSKNPAQIDKRVHSVAPAVGPVLQAFQVDHRDQLTDAVDRFVIQLAEGVRSGAIPPGRNGKVSVFVLGRYNADQQHLPGRPSRFNRYVDVSFLTVHRSKGSEVDYVVLPEMVSAARRRSFPSTRADDAVLALAMPDGDDYPLGEERRLFYVALTRARRGVALFTARGCCSTFLRELEEDGAVVLTDTDGKAIREDSCPACKQGVLVQRTGPYGPFRVCSNFPVCSYKPQQRSAPKLSLSVRQTPPRPAVVRAARSPSPRLAAAAPPPEQKAHGSFLGKIGQALSELSHNIERASALESATSELSLHLDAERTIIEAALQSARQTVHLERELAAKGPEARASFQRTYAELLAAMGEEAAPGLSPSPPLPRSPLPNFGHVGRHASPDIQGAIAAKVDGLHADRHAFLSAVHTQLAGDATLRAQFRADLRRLNGDHYWAALDPQGLLER